MKITPNTTLGELAVELGKYGVEAIHAAIAPSHVRTYRVTLDYITPFHNGIRRSVGDGNTLAAAIDDALARLVHVSAVGLPSEPPPREPL